jgi:hypothetical protein
MNQYQGENGVAYPSVATLASEIGISTRQTMFHLKLLKQRNLIEIKRRVGYRACNHYKVLHPLTSTEISTTENSTAGKRTTTTTVSGMSVVPDTSHEEIKRRSMEEIQSPVEIPASLNSSSFRIAWTDFQEHRRQLHKKLTPLAAKKQLANLAGMGPDRAVAAINHSIAQGWQSIYEPPSRRTGSQPQPTTEADHAAGF